MNWRAIALLSLGGLGVGARAETLRVLTYGSMTGKGSLGEYMAQAWSHQCPGCELKFVTTGETSGLLGRLRADKRRGRASGYDVVLGLPVHHYFAALAAGLVSEGHAFDRSPFAIIVDTQKLPPKDWPRSWKELPTKLKGALLIQDPRTSASGLGWIRSLFEFKLLDLASSRQVVSKVFPSWSAAYEAFTKGAAPAVWSYQTSEAFERCNSKTPDRYRVLPLAGGYPVQEEWVAAAGKQASANVHRFLDFALSQDVQSHLPPLNWMLPVRTDVRLPDCFAHMTPVRTLESAHELALPTIQEWTDQWSL